MYAQILKFALWSSSEIQGQLVREGVIRSSKNRSVESLQVGGKKVCKQNFRRFNFCRIQLFRERLSNKSVRDNAEKVLRVIGFLVLD